MNDPCRKALAKIIAINIVMANIVFWVWAIKETVK